MPEGIVASYHIKGFGFSFREFKEQIGNMFLSGVVGAFIGILPGIGGMTANLVAYSVSKSASKHPEKYGKGYMGGLVASETANNACVGGAMIPLFALGIPGDTFTAVHHRRYRHQQPRVRCLDRSDLRYSRHPDE